MAASRDIQELISKLSSDKAKSRDEGIKLLNSWLEGDRSIGFCRLLARNTARMKPDEIPHAEMWPFLVMLLTKCTVLEISASKKRSPKLILAKTLRTSIQCAEDMKLSDLVLLYTNKVHVGMKANSQSHSKEEIFRCILTLHVRLENPPGDFPDDIRDDLVKEFCGIFSYVSDEGKVSRKLMECINTYLLRDGQNLGCQAMEIHSAMKEFMLRFWLTTHDRVLKISFILYARVQVKICRDTSEGCSLLEQLFDIIVKELDQNSISCSISCTGILRTDPSWDDKFGNKGGRQQGLWELAAAVFLLGFAFRNLSNTFYSFDMFVKYLNGYGTGQLFRSVKIQQKDHVK